jgi:hypothetical protein
VKLSAHIQAWTPGALDWCLELGGPFVKVMATDAGPIRAILERHPATEIIVRLYDGDVPQREALMRDARTAAPSANRIAAMFQHVQLASPRPLWVEGLNEVGLWGDAPAYNAWTVAFAERCHFLGFKPLAYSFPTGNPPGYIDGSPEDLQRYWAHYLDGLRACQRAGGGLALHEYDWPDMRARQTWQCLRYRRVVDILPPDLKRIPIAITECGLDRGASGEPIPPGVRPEDWAGWRALGISSEAYADQLAWYDAETSRDPQVLCATVFTVGGHWPSFEVADHPQIARIVRERASAPTKEAPVDYSLVLPPIVTVQAGSRLSARARLEGGPPVPGLATWYLHLPVDENNRTYGDDPFGVDGEVEVGDIDGIIEIEHDMPSMPAITSPIGAKLRVTFTCLSPHFTVSATTDAVVKPKTAPSSPEPAPVRPPEPRPETRPSHLLTVWDELSIIHEKAGILANRHKDNLANAQDIQRAVAGVKRLVGYAP